MLLITNDDEDGGVRLTVRGELTQAEADRLVREALSVAATAREPGVLIIDLLAVTECDTPGVAALVRIARGCDLVSWRVVLSSAGQLIVDMLERNGFTGWFEEVCGPRKPLRPGSNVG
jgi:ABC-type transporter Mla MlaB component